MNDRRDQADMQSQVITQAQVDMQSQTNRKSEPSVLQDPEGSQPKQPVLRTSGSEEPDEIIHPGQWRLTRVELVNWGTFHGHHRIDVARQGFLITGPSGSGKSSLLDAITSVLTPPIDLNLNAAAQDSSSKGNDRTLLSYVRGAWRRETDDETGEITNSFLRTGATWSGILLRFEDGLDANSERLDLGEETPAQPNCVTLAELFHIKANTNAKADLKQLYVALSEAASLLDFQEYVLGGMEVRKLKAAYPKATVAGEHTPFAHAFRKMLGISNPGALRLLHKTQAAKNFGSLDMLFRNFMLERPETFDMADKAVEQFTHLSTAHNLVVEARKQRDQLRPLLKLDADYNQADADIEDAHALEEARETYTETLHARLLQTELDLLERRKGAALAKAQTADVEKESSREAERQADRCVNELGGDTLTNANGEAERARAELERVKRTRSTWADELARIDLGKVPEDQGAWLELCQTARKNLEATEQSQEKNQRLEYDLHTKRSKAEAQLQDILRELQALRRKPTNMPSRLVGARSLIARQLGLPESTFPFAGELIEVKPEHHAWRGAIERVLRPLATIMLVPAEHIRAVSVTVEKQHLGVRLVFESIPATVPEPQRPTAQDSLIRRIEVTPGHMAGWLNQRLAHAYDYSCVESPADLGSVDRAVTVAGQVKSGSRYEKDDRFAVDDRSRWVLGKDNLGKIDILEARAHDLKAACQELHRAIDVHNANRSKDERSRATLLRITADVWPDIDLAAATRKSREASEYVRQLSEGSSDLKQAQVRLEEARMRRVGADEAATKAHADLQIIEHDREDKQSLLVETRAVLDRQQPVDDALASQLDRLFETEAQNQSYEINLKRLRHISTGVGRGLNRRGEDGHKRKNAAAENITRLLSEFTRLWPASAPDLSPEVDERAAYIGILNRIVSNRLPDFEEQFLKLLREQSRNQTGLLLSTIRSAPREIREHMEPVNQSLLRSAFNKGIYLQIQAKDNKSEQVKEFIGDLQAIASDSWSLEDQEAAEQRFAVLEKIMRRLASSEYADKSWRKQCLDTRLHVTFVAIEQDEDGTQHNIHSSGAGLSGGQKQKLVIFCLAAALRYQLADDEREIPRFGTVVLDEAFDKADNNFTRMAMDIFVKFGFHMILATPLKLLQTLEDYIGGIASVSCLDYQHSSISLVPIEAGDDPKGQAEYA